MHGKRTDVAAWEEKRRDNVAVGRHNHAVLDDVEGRLVVAAAQPFIVERLVEDVGDELRHRAAARAVRQVNASILDVESAAVGLRNHAALRARSRRRPKVQ